MNHDIAQHIMYLDTLRQSLSRCYQSADHSDHYGPSIMAGHYFQDAEQIRRQMKAITDMLESRYSKEELGEVCVRMIELGYIRR